MASPPTETGTGPSDPAAPAESNNVPPPRHRSFTSREYADQVLRHSNITAAQSLFPGDSFKTLAEFLQRPFVTPAPLGHPPARLRPQPPANSTSSPKNPTARFASLYQVAGNKLARLPFDTVAEFEALGDSVLPGAGEFGLLFLQGHPSPAWLNALGGKFGVDPEFFRRHLTFATRFESFGNGTWLKTVPRRVASRILPSCHGDMVSLQTTRIGRLSDPDSERMPQDVRQRILDRSRRRISMNMGHFMGSLAKLRHGVEARSIIREFSAHDFEHKSLEQTISIGIHPAGQGWIGIIWHDGDSFDESSHHWWLEPEWLPKPTPSPIYLHTPGAALGKTEGDEAANTTNSSINDSGGDDCPVSSVPTPVELILNDIASTVDLSRAAQDPFYALSPLFRSVIFSEMGILDLIAAKVRDELAHSRLVNPEAPDQITKADPMLSNLLYHQQILKRHINHLQGPISYMETLLSPATFASGSPWSLPPNLSPWPKRSDEAFSENIRVMLVDYRAALAYAQSLAEDCAQGMGVAAHNATIRESQKAITEAQNMARLTRLVSLFIPIALVTSVFSMNVREINAGDGPPIWAWAVVSVVVGCLGWVFVQYDVRQEVKSLWRDLEFWWWWVQSKGRTILRVGSRR